jgi:hypothetical protein
VYLVQLIIKNNIFFLFFFRQDKKRQRKQQQKRKTALIYHKPYQIMLGQKASRPEEPGLPKRPQKRPAWALHSMLIWSLGGKVASMPVHALKYYIQRFEYHVFCLFQGYGWGEKGLCPCFPPPPLPHPCLWIPYFL